MGGKKTMILTKTKDPKKPNKEKKRHFTAGPALAGVGTAKHVDA
jgi:hypothetical protein